MLHTLVKRSHIMPDGYTEYMISLDGMSGSLLSKALFFFLCFCRQFLSPDALQTNTYHL
jgi:hypothetical protein